MSKHKLSSWWRQYRICTDSWAGYEVQVRYIFFPFWQLKNFSNTFRTIAEAEKFARGSLVVKYL